MEIIRTRFQTSHLLIRMLIVAIAVAAAAISTVGFQTDTLGWLGRYWGVPSYGGW